MHSLVLLVFSSFTSLFKVRNLLNINYRKILKNITYCYNFAKKLLINEKKRYSIVDLRKRSDKCSTLKSTLLSKPDSIFLHETGEKVSINSVG